MKSPYWNAGVEIPFILQTKMYMKYCLTDLQICYLRRSKSSAFSTQYSRLHVRKTCFPSIDFGGREIITFYKFSMNSQNSACEIYKPLVCKQLEPWPDAKLQLGVWSGSMQFDAQTIFSSNIKRVRDYLKTVADKRLLRQKVLSRAVDEDSPHPLTLWTPCVGDKNEGRPNVARRVK